MKKILLIFLLLITAIAAASCSELRATKSFKEIVEQEMAIRYKTDEIGDLKWIILI